MDDLWSDKVTPERCVEYEYDKVIYNLYEDIQCLKEEINELKSTNEKLKKERVNLLDQNTRIQESDLRFNNAYLKHQVSWWLKAIRESEKGHLRKNKKIKKLADENSKLKVMLAEANAHIAMNKKGVDDEHIHSTRI